MSIPVSSITRAKTVLPVISKATGYLGARSVSSPASDRLNLRVPFKAATLARSGAIADVIHLPYEGLMVPGGGINSLTGKATGAQVVSHGNLRRIEGADATTDGQTTRTYISIVESVEQFNRQMSATMSGGGSYGMFSGSASYSRSEAEDFDSQATTVVAMASVVNGLEYFTNGQLEEEALQTAKKDPERFIKRFGDSYVQGLLRGGCYVARVSILSESRDVQKKLAGSVKASFQGFGGGSGSFSEEVKAYRKFSDIKITFLQRGGTNEDHANLGVNFEALGDKINKFPRVVSQSPVTLTALASSYLSLDNFPNPADDRLNIQHQRERLEEYARIRNRYATLRKDVQWVQEKPEMYLNPPAQAVLTRWQNELTEKQNAVESGALRCIEKSTQCPAIAFSLPDGFAMPKRLDSTISDEESAKLGSVWTVKEGDWTGTWSRIGHSRLFDAVWLKGREMEKALLQIHVQGDTIRVARTHSHGVRNGNTYSREGDCHYSGTLSNKKGEGTYACPWGSHLNWSATIS